MCEKYAGEGYNGEIKKNTGGREPPVSDRQN
jgi:hypothetical protein